MDNFCGRSGHVSGSKRCAEFESGYERRRSALLTKLLPKEVNAAKSPHWRCLGPTSSANANNVAEACNGVPFDMMA